MPSTFSKPVDYQNIAEMYSEANDVQVKFGKKLLTAAGVRQGDKVLDMGCGTGELTEYIAGLVGNEGHVHGIDPDQERIKIAVEKHSSAADRNLSFTVGDSSSLSVFRKEYYNIHFSNFVFQWLSDKEKEVFIKTAFKCLKPGGQIAIQSHEMYSAGIMAYLPELFAQEEIGQKQKPYHLVHKSVTESLLRKAGFVIVSSEYIRIGYNFPNLDEFLTWYCASDYVDGNKILPQKKEAFAKKFVNEDGTVTLLEPTVYQIIAKKSPCVIN